MRHYTFVDYATQGYVAVVGVLVALFHNDTVPHWRWMLAGHAVCLAAVHGLIHWHARRPSARVLAFLRHFYPILLYTELFRESGLLNRMFHETYLDPMVIGWEQAVFGCQPSVLFMEMLPHLLVSELFYAAYFSYYIMIAGIGLALFLRDREQFFHYVSVVSFIFYTCYTIYIFLPVIGPRVFFRAIDGYALPSAFQALATSDDYPDAVEAGVFFRIMALIYNVFEAPGAALPSSHVAVALATVHFSFRYLPRLWRGHLAVAVLLCGATVYCRYHYVVDVLAGLATVGVLLPLGNWLYFKFKFKPGPPAVAAANAPPQAVTRPPPESVAHPPGSERPEGTSGYMK
ncbi:MAG: phosphatase PAP2 family protein [Verrucomicrobia bacterium]|nr:phosphatase PAP2 family protein [Verrucomicrobiota bacterium]